MSILERPYTNYGEQPKGAAQIGIQEAKREESEIGRAHV